MAHALPLHPRRDTVDTDAEKGGLEYREASRASEELVEDGAQDGHAIKTDGHGHALIHIDPKAEARLVRKLDLYLMPWFFLMYLFSFVDRINIGNARLYGLEKDLGMAGYDYNVAVTLFFITYTLFELPFNVLVKVCGPGWFLPIATIIFGIVSMSTAYVQSFAGLAIARLVLGAAECSLLPGSAYALTRWYTRREAGMRMGIYLLGAPLSGAFGGLLAYGIVHDIPNITWLTQWRLVFWVEGLCTAAVGLLALAFLADRPETARFLNHDERALALARIKAENVGATRVLEATRKQTVRQGIFNINSWICGAIMLLAAIAVQGFSVFLPTIISAIYPTISPVDRNLRSCPPYLVGFAGSFLIPLFILKTGKRALAVLVSVPLGVIGYALFIGATDPNARYAGSFLIAWAVFPMAPIAYGWCAANLAPDAARASGIGIIGLLMNVGGLISSWTYLPYQAPRYVPGNALGIVVCILIWLCAAGGWAYCRWENKQRDMGKRDHRLDGLDEEQRGLLGSKHPEFRYVC